MIAMLQKKWKSLPAALRTVLTLLAVTALAALLATVRHNASAYRTGVWDTGSQTLIYGRMHQMEQGQHAPGGFLGVYTEDWSDDQNRSWFREDTPADAAQFRPYTHQSGLQGWALGGLNRLLRVFLPEGIARETALYWVNSTLFYAVQLLTALAVWQELGLLPAAFWMAAILLAPWLQRGMKDLYWVPWTWQLPLLAVLLLCRCTCARGRTPRWCWPLVSLAVLVRCMCGFEFVTTFLILCEIPLCYAAAKAYCVAKAPQRACRWLGRAVGAGAAALTGAAAALALWFGQECLCFGSVAEYGRGHHRPHQPDGRCGAGCHDRAGAGAVFCAGYRAGAAAGAGCRHGGAAASFRAGGRRGQRGDRAAARRGGAACAAGRCMAAQPCGPGLVDGAFQSARRHTYPSCADAVALCLCAGQLYAAAGAGCTAYPGEEKRSCGIPLNITGPSTIIKCW